MKEFTQTLYTIADDAHMHVTFDPSLVKQYRLIGFDNKVGALADSTSEVEGGKLVLVNPLQLLLKLSQILQVVQMYIQIILQK